MSKQNSAMNRSWMFVPGNKERFLSKARASSADVVLLDLEDGVLPDEKSIARDMLADIMGQEWGPKRYVRINALTTTWWLEDLNAVVQPGLSGVCMTKVTNEKEIHVADAILCDLERRHGMVQGSVRILAAIESARGLLNAAGIADASPRLSGLMFGAEDFALDLGLGTRREYEAAELIHARSSIVIAAAAANVLSVDGVFPNLDDAEGLLQDVNQARRLGFRAKATFNPRQIDVINRVFSPQPDEIAYARRVAEGFREAEARGEASVAVGGQLVDRPIVLRALQLLEAIET